MILPEDININKQRQQNVIICMVVIVWAETPHGAGGLFEEMKLFFEFEM